MLYYMIMTFHVKDRWTCKRNVVNWYGEQTKKLLDNKVLFFGKKFSISYVIIHELFHLVDFNHSDHFWELVEQAFPATTIVEIG
jgi:hypothetical protein